MASEIKVDTIVNAGGDNDSGIDLATNDIVAVKTANTERMRVDASGNVGIGTSDTNGGRLVVGNTVSGDTSFIQLLRTGVTERTNFIGLSDSDALVLSSDENNEGADSDIRFKVDGSERMRIDSTGNLLVAKTTADANTVEGIQLSKVGTIVCVRNDNLSAIFNRQSNDGNIIAIQQANNTEGTVSVSGATVSYNGFSGLHESSGIATNTPIGTVVSTIDELDVYAPKQGEAGEEEDCPKAGQTRADHAKVEISNTVGDKAVYGVVGSFNAQGKVNVASVGIGSVRVTGACAKGDLLESNGDGTAKVQSDDIVRSKTIGKVTIGNSNSGVKLVSCVLYCG